MRRSLSIGIVLGLLLAGLSSFRASAQVELRNDGWESGQPLAFQQGFVSGEIAAVRLVPNGPCPCPVTRVRFLLGGAQTQQTITLRIWDDSLAGTEPGVELFSSDYQVQGADSSFQEVDLTAENIAVLGAFRVGIEFQHSGLPSVARDSDGITPELNFIYTSDPLWVQSSLFGIAGDWIIRADVDAEGDVLGDGDLRNDGWHSGQTVAFHAGFVAGEIAAVRLLPDVPCPCPLNRVRFVFGGAEQIESVTLHVWDDGAGTDAPGAELYSGSFEIVGFDRALQEIDLRTQGIEVSGAFRVGLEFGHSGLPSVARDTDGSNTPDRNFIYTSDPLWVQSSLLAVAGDWIIRASVGDEPAASELELGNDGWFPGEAAGFQIGFLAGETAAVRLVPDGPCPCPIEAVRFLFGGAEEIETVTLHVWEDDAGTDDPGTELYSGPFEIAGFDQALQEIDLSSQVIEVDGAFRVGLEFSHAGLPSVARDDDGGITADRNFIDEATAGWVESSTVFVTGDWIIRAVFDTAPGSVELANDGWSFGETLTFQQDFQTGEAAASRLVPTVPCPCPVEAVRLVFGGAEGEQTVTLRVWDDSAQTADPGAALLSGDFALTPLDDGLSEIDLRGEGLTIDGPVRVAVEFSHSGLPSIARDEDGITHQRNFVRDTGDVWAESLSQGVFGDWILRLVVPEPSATCLRLAAILTVSALARRRWRHGVPI
jgi:hypothetical protein